jgi:hypothetical protein
MHVHLREPGWERKEDFRTGTRAAVHGGVTTLVDMPNNPVPADTKAAIVEKLRLAREKSLVDVRFNGGVDPKKLSEVSAMSTDVVGYKVYLSETTGAAAFPPSELSACFGALVGRIGNSDAATPFVVGADGTVTVPVAGRLYLGINQDATQSPSGSYDVHIERTPGSGTAAAKSNYDFKPLFAQLDAKLPYRVGDKPEGGNPGDLVNFVIIGSQQQVTNAFKTAGWLQADKDNKAAVLSALEATLQKNSYMTVPMSILYLYGRPQDFGFERTDPVLVAAQRHHFRIWNSPFSTPQQTIWSGAGTHDIGIEKDQRSKNAITHKIDQNVDGERDFIGATLTDAGMVQAMDYMTRSHPITSTKTATGGEIKSDGRVLVIVLKPAQKS